MKTETLVSKIKSGDSQALRFVYELFYKSVYQAAYYITNDTGLAEDSVHEVFIKLQYKINQLEDPSKLEAWLCRMAVNTARDIIRQRSRSTLFAEARGIYSESQLLSPDTILLNNEEKQAIKKHLEYLKLEHRQVIYLKYYQEMSCEEMSTTLDVPVGTVKSRLFHARQEIRKLLEPEGSFKQHIAALKTEEV